MRNTQIGLYNPPLSTVENNKFNLLEVSKLDSNYNSTIKEINEVENSLERLSSNFMSDVNYPGISYCVSMIIVDPDKKIIDNSDSQIFKLIGGGESKEIEKRSKDIIYSLYLNIDDENREVEGILDRFQYNWMGDSQYSILFVVWGDFEPASSYSMGKDVGNREVVLTTLKVNYNYFFINLESLISRYEIVIFSSLHWSNILLLFQIHGYILNGGSITKRHKLSLTQYRLSNFIRLNRLNPTAQNFHTLYSDKYLSSNKLERKYYELFKKVKTSSGISVPTNYTLDKFYEFNDKLRVINLINLNSKESERYQKELSVITSWVESYPLLENKYNEELEYFMKHLSQLKSKEISTMSSKHRMNHFNKIKSIEHSISTNHKKLEDDTTEFNRKNELKNTITSKLTSLAKTKTNLISELKTLESTNSSKIAGSNRSDLVSAIGSIRSYSTNAVRKDINKAVIKNRNGSFNIGSPIYEDIIRTISNSPINEETQLKIERYLVRQGAILFTQNFNLRLDLNYTKLTQSILAAIQNSIPELEHLLNNWRFSLSNDTTKSYKSTNLNAQARVMLEYINNTDLIGYMLGRVLKIISNNNLVNRNTLQVPVAIDLARDLVIKYIASLYKESSNSDIGLSEFKLSRSDLSTYENEEFLFGLGIQLLHILEESKLISCKIVQLAQKERQSIWVASKPISDSLIKSSTGGFIFLDLPYKLPMIVPPKKYIKDGKGQVKLGGYLLNDVEFDTPIIIHNPELKEQSVISDTSSLYRTINNINSVGFKINTEVLDFIYNNAESYKLVTDPKFRHPLEFKKKLTMHEAKELEGFRSKKHLEMNILGIANIYRLVPEFFIPIRMDNRGRIYCISNYLNYQSIELAKALLLFSRGEEILKSDNNAIKFLKIFGANCFGNGIDKLSFEDRVKWVDDKDADIMDFENGSLINKAESKLLFIAFCFEYRHYKNALLNDKTYYVSYFPIQLDATCNGYQHLALLTGNDDLAKELNLVLSSSDELPKDFYLFISLRLKEYFKKEIEENKGNNDATIATYKKLVELNLNRKLIKSTIMVKPYNASQYQMANYIKNQFNVVKTESTKSYVHPSNKDIYLTDSDFMLLSKVIDRILINEFPKLQEFILYLNRVAQICSILNIPIIWALPTGLNINQYYTDSEAIRLKPFTNRKLTYTLAIGNKKLYKSKQIRALMPNLIHSLDASSLALLVNEYFDSEYNANNFYSIHDCFAVPASKVSKMIRLLKLVYINIYSENQYILRFDKGIKESIKTQFGDHVLDEDKGIISVIIQGELITLDFPNIKKVIFGKIAAESIQNSEYIIN